MKKLIKGIIILIIFWGCENSSSSNKEKKMDTFPQIGILGIFHFAGTTDYSSVEFESLESEKRQREILEIVEKLKPFKPTKVLVEYPAAKSTKLDSIYHSYLKGKHELTINEIEQVGFRLAQQLKHSKIYSIDYHLNLPFSELIEYAEKNDQDRLNELLSSIKKQDKKESEYLQKNTLVDYLIYRNSNEEDLRNKNQYLNNTAKFVSDTNYIGAKFVSKWWERNIMIMSNIDRLIQKDDRILVIIGAAHRAILRDFYEDRIDVDYIEIQDFLKNNTTTTTKG